MSFWTSTSIVHGGGGGLAAHDCAMARAFMASGTGCDASRLRAHGTMLLNSKACVVGDDDVASATTRAKPLRFEGGIQYIYVLRTADLGLERRTTGGGFIRNPTHTL